MLHHPERLAGVYPRLAACVARAAELCPFDVIVIEGVRTAERQAQLYAQGRTAPGEIVTWVTVSNHQAKADGFGHAVDIGALKPDGEVEWSSTAAYDTVKAAMFAAAAAMSPPLCLRWGADWNMNGVPREHGETDQDHFETHGDDAPAPVAQAVAA